jgi:hypothetical protein
MDYNDIRQKATAWMITRDWKRRTAKRGGFNQSLFEHTIYELDALLTLWPILSKSWGLGEQDLAALAVGSVAHDVGKEMPEWQNYVLADRGTVPYTPHIVEDLTQAAVDKLFEALGLTGSLDDAKAFVRYHMQATKTSDSLIFDVINKGSKSNRWMTLSNIVAEIDNVCSAKGLLEGVRALERSSIGKHLNVTYHLVQIRGVSTALLHRAAIEAYEAAGWRPLLHYSNGTIYVASSADKVAEPTVRDIESRLAAIVNGAMQADYSRLIVGNPTTTVLPKPELFDYREMRAYLETAGGRVGYTAFLRRQLEDVGTRKGRKNTVKEYMGRVPTDKEVEKHSQRISDAYPETAVFCFFKAAFNGGLLGDAQKPTTLKEAYEEVFGKGTFESFKKSSAQLSPARHMQLVIDPFWELPGSHFGLATAKVGQAPNAARKAALVNALASIAAKVYATLELPPQRIAGSTVAQVVINDLVCPTRTNGVEMLVSEQLEAYVACKEYAGRDNGRPHICPICNRVFSEGTLANDSLIDQPGSFTNRIPSHGGPNGDVLCTSCKFEIFLRQLLLGGKPAELLVLFPRMNIGQGSGVELVRRARELQNRAMSLMSNDTQDPNEHVSLSLTQMIARKLSEQDVFTLSPHALLDLFTYSASGKARDKSQKELEDKLREEYGETVDDLNDSWGTDFDSWNVAVQALIDNRVSFGEARDILKEVYNLYPVLQFVCQTPHLILIPVSRSFAMRVGKDEEAKVNAAIRRLFTMLILGLALDCSVAVLNSGDAITFEGGEGVARVPKAPALRDLVGDEWVSLDQAEKWLKAIGAASLIAQATGLPERSNLYQILSAPTPGHILRRIEQQSESGAASYKHIRHLETLKEVMR